MGAHGHSSPSGRLVNVARPSLFTSTEPVAVFRGGYSRGVRYASPFLRLVEIAIFSDGVRVAPVSPFLGIFVPTWECSFDRLSEAEVSGTAVKGIRFHSVDNPEIDRPTITFVPYRQLSEVIAALGSAGVAIKP
jgi:hypothetical protein